VSGAFYGFSGFVDTCAGGCVKPWYEVSGFPIPMPVDGTLTFANGGLASFNLNINHSHYSPDSFTATVSPNEQNWTVAFHDNNGGYDTDLTLTNSGFIASLFQVSQPGLESGRSYDGYQGTFTTFVGTVSQVPLPGALPLFATGLGVLGLLGWRRKRKIAT
jgi:hypothetical protein